MRVRIDQLDTEDRFWFEGNRREAVYLGKDESGERYRWRWYSDKENVFTYRYVPQHLPYVEKYVPPVCLHIWPESTVGESAVSFVCVECGAEVLYW